LRQTAAQPTTLEGIEKYLGSGMIRGIGPTYARALGLGLGQIGPVAPFRVGRLLGGEGESARHQPGPVRCFARGSGEQDVP